MAHLLAVHHNPHIRQHEQPSSVSSASTGHMHAAWQQGEPWYADRLVRYASHVHMFQDFCKYLHTNCLTQLGSVQLHTFIGKLQQNLW